jgi:ParB/RepB/Spo0J family partition protein
MAKARQNQKKVGRLQPVARQILDIPIDQLIPDPNQPRIQFDEKALGELALSIQNQGLQQPPTVNFFEIRDGLPYYYLKTGERRWRAHKLLGRKAMSCIIETDPYQGDRSFTRRLAQAAENSSRVPHTHNEILQIVEEAIEYEKLRSSGLRGYVNIALTKVATAFGKSHAWAQNYHNLAGLHQNLRPLLEKEISEGGMNLPIALGIARVPADSQLEEFKVVRKLIDDKGISAGMKYINGRGRTIKVARGERVRGRGYDEKLSFLGAISRMRRIAESLSGDRKRKEQLEFLTLQISRMSTSEVDLMLVDIKFIVAQFGDLLGMLEKKRADNYAKFR